MRRSGPKNISFALQKQSTSATRDIAGQLDMTDDDNWQTFATRRGSMMTPKGSEFWNVDQVDSNGVRKVEFVADSMTRLLTPHMRLRTGSRNLNIESVENLDGKNREVIVYCVEQK